MNPIDELFQKRRAEMRTVFMPFLTAGDPDLVMTERLLPAIASAGADLIEVGFPFSDPIADGPVIQASYTRALNKGVKLDQIFSMLRRVTSSPGWSTPLVAMVSFSLVHRFGPTAFLEQAGAAGLSGAIVPDLTAEEAPEFAARAKEKDFKLILLTTPTTTPARAEQIVKLSTGFLYCVSIVGITGERDRLPETLREQLQRLRLLTDLPLCVGFGISKPEQAKQLRGIADGVIVGSALVRKLEAGRGGDEAGLIEDVVKLIAEFARAVR